MDEKISKTLSRVLIIIVFAVAFALLEAAVVVYLRKLFGFDADVFFLIPVPWVGPILTPMVIFTLLFILGIYLYFNQTPFQSKESK